MAETTGIEWADGTWNPWQGCQKVSEGCEHCYMFREKYRYGQNPNVVVRSAANTFNMPLSTRRVPSGTKLFVCSWSDFFHQDADAWRWDAYEIMRRRPDVTFILVTKRIERAALALPRGCTENIWLLPTCENQQRANERIPQAINLSYRVGLVGVSVGPMIRPVDLTPWLKATPSGNQLEWVICEGEAGNADENIRPMHPDWPRSLRKQCVSTGVPFLFKQWGDWAPGYGLDDRNLTQATVFHDGRWFLKGEKLDHPAASQTPKLMYRVGKRAAGRLLDGIEWNQFPEIETTEPSTQGELF